MASFRRVNNGGIWLLPLRFCYKRDPGKQRMFRWPGKRTSKRRVTPPTPVVKTAYARRGGQGWCPSSPIPPVPPPAPTTRNLQRNRPSSPDGALQLCRLRPPSRLPPRPPGQPHHGMHVARCLLVALWTRFKRSAESSTASVLSAGDSRASEDRAGWWDRWPSSRNGRSSLTGLLKAPPSD